MSFLSVAREAALIGREVHLRYLTGGFHISTKSGVRDRVTTADIEAEKAIVAFIREAFPTHNILAEEHSYEPTSSPYTWIIDPLDGTNNFSRGFPFFACSVALKEGDEVIVGAVCDSVRGEIFTAEKGGGAFLNEEPIHVSEVSDLATSLLVTGFYQTQSEEVVRNLEVLKRLFRRGILGIRRTGAAALDLCYVACGRVDGFWEPILNPWDFAAGALIVREAGGMCTTYEAEPLPFGTSPVLATNGRLHTVLSEVIREALS
ncbi:inositol monophosphatase family protein [Spirochaeta thermophila]|uniref:Inositol-1-monophosphatase n=1 Tax=Winmispira thermophila (strain ATCC 49972 / DSM 6192 / RI 19.B1) TaxID=665571 RepID=E0RR37_WINT6|nr:inositol monophosphatase family protein [Spirochaeta thermophila]ADN01615.1 inositol-1-monophosphatase [Spirochaeta thermophila DSM 6192]